MHDPLCGLVRAGIAAVVFGALALVPAAIAAKKEKTVDRVWAHARFDSFKVERIAVLPVVSFDNDFASEKVVEGALGQAFAPTGYRWISVTTTREVLRSVGGDSLVKLMREKVVSAERFDSLSAPGLCARLRCDALLAVRVEHWEKLEMEWNQAGKPSTSVRLRGSLVDSTGTLLWSASGSQTGEGPYHDPNQNPIGVTGGGLDRKPVTGQGGAPEFVEVVLPLAKRWAAQFPAARRAEAKP